MDATDTQSNQNGPKAGNSSELGIGTSSELELKSENY